MMRFRWQILTVGVGAVLILLLILAMRGLPARSAPAGAVATRGGHYQEALVGGLQRLNPIFEYRNAPDRDVDRLVFSGLVRFDSTGMPVGDLAQGWVIGDDNTTYTFILRPDAVWQDGQPVTAQDVVYTYGLLQDKAYAGPADLAALWQSVKVEAVEDKVVRFTLPEPYAPFLDYLTVGLLPDHLLHGVGVAQLDNQTFNLQPVGTGPYRVQTLILKNDAIAGVTLVPFDKYYGGQPYLSQIDFLYYPSQDAAFADLQAGTVMGLGGLSAEEVGALMGDKQYNLYTARTPESSLILLNLNNSDVPFLGDRNIRQALLLAINRQKIIDTIYQGQAVPAAGPILPGTWAADPSLTPVDYDPDAAARLLDGAGWTIPAGAAAGTPDFVRQKDGAALAFTMVYTEDPTQQAIAEAIQADWAAAGVQVTLKAANARSLLSDNLETRTYQAALVTFNQPYPDPDPYPFWDQTQFPNGQNYSQLDDRAISEVLEAARIDPNIDTRAKDYRTFQYRFAYQLPALYLWLPTYSYAVDARISGLTLGPLFTPSDRLSTVTSWYMLEMK